MRLPAPSLATSSRWSSHYRSRRNMSQLTTRLGTMKSSVRIGNVPSNHVSLGGLRCYWTVAPPAVTQLDNNHKNALHSLNCGLIIHRVGQINYDFIPEARSFATELQHHMNKVLDGEATIFMYEEALGKHGRMHWFVHMKSPNDYRRLLEMVDHDKIFQDIYQSDRLPERGGGNWERMFVQSSFQERVLVPQHGFAKESMDTLDTKLFVPPALHQIPSKLGPFLDSGTAGAIILRTGHACYESRDLARCYLHEWQRYINAVSPGIITSAQFEEVWGAQDRLHMLIHLRSPDDYRLFYELEARDKGLQELMTKPRATIRGEVVCWGGLFQSTSMTDTVLLPMISK